MNVYDKALQLLERHGWNQGASTGPKGEICLGFAVDAACVALGQQHSGGQLTGTTWFDRLETIVRSKPFNRGFRITYSVPGWNDRICKSFADVKAVLVLASEQYEAERVAAGDPDDEVTVPDPVTAINQGQVSYVMTIPAPASVPKELVSA